MPSVSKAQSFIHHNSQRRYKRFLRKGRKTLILSWWEAENLHKSEPFRVLGHFFAAANSNGHCVAFLPGSQIKGGRMSQSCAKKWMPSWRRRPRFPTLSGRAGMILVRILQSHAYYISDCFLSYPPTWTSKHDLSKFRWETMCSSLIERLTIDNSYTRP